MKKLIIALLILTPFATFGATQVVKVIKSYDNVAQIELGGSNLQIYKYEDPANKATCYVVNSDKASWGISPSISCVK